MKLLPLIILPTLLAPIAMTTSEHGNAPAQLVSGPDFTVAGALAEIPVDGAGEFVQLAAADIVAASEASGLERPAAGSSTDDVIGWLGPLTGQPLAGHAVAPVFVPFAETLGMNYARELDKFKAELGWSLLDVDSFVEWLNPPDRFLVVTGAFDDSTLNPALAETAPGIVTAGEGEDFMISASDRTAARPLGQPLHMSVDDNRIAVSPSTPMTQAWIDGTSPTLADAAPLAAVAAALDDADAMSAALWQGLPDRGGPLDRPPVADDVVLLDPFDAVGIGWAVEDGRPVVTIAYAFADEATAAAMVDPMTALYTDGASVITFDPFSAFFALDDIGANGSVISVRILPVDNEHVSLPYRMLMSGDLLFMHS